MFGKSSISATLENNRPTVNVKPMEFVDPNPLLDFISDLNEKTNPNNCDSGKGPSVAHKGPSLVMDSQSQKLINQS